MNLLIVEDERELAKSMAAFLHSHDYRCDVALGYFQALDKINLYAYDCIVIDIILPDGNGLDLVRRLKEKHSRSGVIIVSAKNALDDKITGLAIGADDYLTKPFHLPELAARIQAVIRRRQFDGEKQIVFHEIVIRPDERVVRVNKQIVKLTKNEYELLLYFIGNKNRVLTREAIAEHLLGNQADLLDSFDFIYTHVKNLRKKIIRAGGGDYIKTIYAIGYKFGEK